MTTRRSLLAASAALPFATRARAAQLLTSLAILVPANPGGGWDGLGRAIEQVAVGGGVVGRCQFENVGGAGGTLGLARFVQQRRGRPDSLLVSGSTMVGAILTNRSPVTLEETPPVARLTDEAGVIVVPANSPFGDIRALAAALQANPRGVSVAGAAGGSIDHVILGLMLRALGRSAREAGFVAFAGGGPAQAAILGGQVQASISGWGEFAEQIRTGRLRALATSGERRTDPAVPTLKESGIDVVMTNWRGVFAAPGVRPEARARLTEAMQAMYALPAWRTLLAERGWEDAFLAGPALEAFMARDRQAMATVLQELGLA